MGGYLGSYEIDDLCTFYVNTHTPATGAAVDADAAAGYRIYEDETGTPILTGTMALLDDANTVGFYSEQITLSAANGFEAGKSYCIRKTLVVGGVTGVDLDKLQVGAKVDVRRLGGVVQSATDLKDFADDGYDPSTNKVQGVVLTDTVTTYTGNTVQTGDNFARLGVNGVGLSAIPDLAGVTTLLARLSAVRAGYLDNVNNATLAGAAFPTDPADQSLVIAATDAIVAAIGALNNLSAAGVRTAVGLASANLDTQLTDLPTNAELATALGTADDATLAAIAALNNLSQANIRTAVGLATANLDTQLDALPTAAELATALGTADDATLAAIAALNNLSATGVENAVWNTVLASHLTAGSTGAALNAAGSAGDPWGTALPGAYGAGSAGNLVGTNLNATVSSRLASAGYTPPLDAAGTRTAVGLATANLDTQLDALPTNGELTTALAAADDATLSAIAALNNLSAAGVRTAVGLATANLDTQLAAIAAKTAGLPSGIQKNTALSNFSFLMVDSTDHVSPEIGLTVTATRSLDGAAFAACANAVAELSNGIYKINLAAADLNGDVVVLRFVATGSDDRFISLVTEP